MPTATKERKPRARTKKEEPVTPKGKRKTPAAPEPKRRKRNIEPAKQCTMCSDGKFEDTKFDYEFNYKNETIRITGVPCQECDRCGGRKYNTDDVTRPSAYAKQVDVPVISYKEAMAGYWKMQEQARAQKSK